MSELFFLILLHEAPPIDVPMRQAGASGSCRVQYTVLARPTADASEPLGATLKVKAVGIGTEAVLVTAFVSAWRICNHCMEVQG